MIRPPSPGRGPGRGGLFFALLLLCAPFTAAAEKGGEPAARRPHLALAPLKTLNVSEGDALVVADSLRSDLTGTRAFRVVDRAQMEQILGEQRFQLLGVTNGAEAVRLGRILNVQEMVFGSLSRLDKNYYLSVTAISIETAEIKASRSVEAGSLKKLRAKLPQIAREIVQAYGGR